MKWIFIIAAVIALSTGIASFVLMIVIKPCDPLDQLRGHTSQYFQCVMERRKWM